MRPAKNAHRGGKDDKEIPMKPPDMSTVMTLKDFQGTDTRHKEAPSASKQEEVLEMTTRHTKPEGQKAKKEKEQPPKIGFHNLAENLNLPKEITVVTAKQQREAREQQAALAANRAPKPNPTPAQTQRARPPAQGPSSAQTASVSKPAPPRTEESEAAVLERADSIVETTERLRKQLQEKMATLATQDPIEILKLEEKMLASRSDDAKKLLHAREIVLMHANGSRVISEEHVAAARFVVDNMQQMNPHAIPLADNMWAVSEVRMRIASANTTKAERAKQAHDALRARVQGTDAAHPETLGPRGTLYDAIMRGTRGLLVQPVGQDEKSRGPDIPLALLEALDGPNEGDVKIRLVLCTPNVREELRVHTDESFVLRKHLQKELGVYFWTLPDERAKDPFGLLRKCMQETFTVQKKHADQQVRIQVRVEENKRMEAERRVTLAGFAQNARPLFELLKGEAGVAVVNFPNYHAPSVQQAGNLTLYLEGDGNRIHLRDWEASDPPRGWGRIDLSSFPFPKDGIPIQQPESEANSPAYSLRNRLYGVAKAEIQNLTLKEYNDWANHEGSLLHFREGGRGIIKHLLTNFPVEALGMTRAEVSIALVVHGTSRNYKVLKAFCPCLEIPGVEELIPLNLDHENPELVALLAEKPEIELLVRLLRVALAREARAQTHQDNGTPAEDNPPAVKTAEATGPGNADEGTPLEHGVEKKDPVTTEAVSS